MKHFILTQHVFCQKVPVPVIQSRCAKSQQRKRFSKKPKSSHNMKNMDQFLFIITIYILVPLFTHYYPKNRGTRIEILYFIVNFDKFFFSFQILNHEFQNLSTLTRLFVGNRIYVSTNSCDNVQNQCSAVENQYKTRIHNL